jgi:phage terminase large subunit
VTRRPDDFAELDRALAARDPNAPRVAPELRKLSSDPAAFARRVLGVKLTAIQRGMLEAIKAHDRFAIACGQRTGRTMVFAVLLLWWCSTRENARALLSTPSHGHMRSTIWRQVQDLMRYAKVPLEADCFELPSRGVQFKNGNEVIGIASDTGERLQGYAAANLLIVVDEAAGYPEHLVPALMSNLAGGGRVVIGGNPTNNTSYFAKRWKADNWHTVNVSALDVAQSKDRQPGQADPAWCSEMLEEHGADSLLYRARVLGQFSEQNANGVFSLAEIEQAQARWDEAMAQGGFEHGGRLEIGLDVARSGLDWSVAVARRGPIALAPVAWKVPDLVEVAQRVLALVQEYKRAGERPIVRVDGVGVGAGVVDVLRRSPGIRVVDVQAAAAPARDAYTNTRSEAVFVCRDWLRNGGCLPRDARLEGEMSALSYCFDPRNRLKILSKDELRRELGRSTDRFDALSLAVYDPPESVTISPRCIPIGPYAKPMKTGPTDLFGRPLGVAS